MIKSIQRFLESFADFISRGVKDLVDPINKSLRRSKTAMIGMRQAELPAVQDMIPLAVEPPTIQVECISCGSIGELTGICQKCHGPVCSRSFCRKDVHNVEMDMEVILCRDCAAAT